jgi:hypothetical protein
MQRAVSTAESLRHVMTSLEDLVPMVAVRHRILLTSPVLTPSHVPSRLILNIQAYNFKLTKSDQTIHDVVDADFAVGAARALSNLTMARESTSSVLPTLLSDRYCATILVE